MNAIGTAALSSLLLGASNTAGTDTGHHAWGVAAFVGVYVLLLIWLCLMPRRLLDEPAGRPWWQSSRIWAIAIALFQILVYLGLG